VPYHVPSVPCSCHPIYPMGLVGFNNPKHPHAPIDRAWGESGCYTALHQKLTKKYMSTIRQRVNWWVVVYIEILAYSAFSVNFG